MKKILVVDDDPGILEVMKIILEDSEYQVATSEDGQIFGMIERDRPDLILLDVLLSGADGREVAKKLKSGDKTSGIPIVMISAHPSATESALKSGADDFLPKPFEIDHLLQVVDRNINQ